MQIYYKPTAKREHLNMSESYAPTQNILNIEIKKILNIVWALVISHHPIMLYYLFG